MNAYQKAKEAQTDIFLGDLEKRAFESNTAFGVYEYAKATYGTRPDLAVLTAMISTGFAQSQGHQYNFDMDTGQAYIDNQPINVQPLYEALDETTDFDYVKQRKAYLSETMDAQERYIRYDSRGFLNDNGVEVNSEIAKARVLSAAEDLKPDHENVNPNGFFKTNMTAAQKMRLMSTTIDTIKADVKASLRKLASKEKSDISQPIFDKHSARIAKAIFDGDLEAGEATKINPSHEISEQHTFFREGLQGVEGANHSENLHIGHLKHMPKDYITQKERVSNALKVDYGNSDSRLKIISRQLEAFINAKGELNHANPVDFSVGIDLDRLYVDTKKLLAGNIVDGKSCVLNADARYKNIKHGEFAIPATTMLSRPLSHYDAMVLTTGPIASAAISTALSDRNVLVVDTLEDSNVINILSVVRDNHQVPVVLFTDNNVIHEFVESAQDKNICSNLSKDLTWGEKGLYNMKEGLFDDFKADIDNVLTTSLEPPNKVELPPSASTPVATQEAEIIKNIQPTPTPTINRHRVGL